MSQNQNHTPEQPTPSVSELLQIRRDKLAALQQQGQNSRALRNTSHPDIHAQRSTRALISLKARRCALPGGL